MKAISKRVTQPEDDPFLFQLFVSSRQDFQYIVGIDENMRDMLYRQQYMAEKLQFEELYEKERFYMVLYKENPIGRLYMHCDTKGMRIIAIALLPQFQNQGIGTYLLEEVLEEARKEKQSIFLQVAWYNHSARALYQRLGFFVKEDTGVFCEMQWNP